MTCPPHPAVNLKETFKKAKDAARRAWAFNERYDLEMPSPDWVVDTVYGEQDCYNIMVRSDGLDWEPEDEFVRYVASLVHGTWCIPVH